LLPLVEDLVHHHEAQFVAQVDEFRRVRIVSRPDGVAAHGLQDLEAPLPKPAPAPPLPPNRRRDAGRRRSVSRACRSAGIPCPRRTQPVDPKDRVVRVGALIHHRGAHPVKIGILERPQVRLVHPYLLHELVFSVGCDALLSLTCAPSAGFPSRSSMCWSPCTRRRWGLHSEPWS